MNTVIWIMLLTFNPQPDCFDYSFGSSTGIASGRTEYIIAPSSDTFSLWASCYDVDIGSYTANVSWFHHADAGQRGQ